MENKDMPAFPQPPEGVSFKGLSKREYFAAMALQGLMSNPVYNNPDDPKKLPTVTNFAIAARFYADALLLELSKP